MRSWTSEAFGSSTLLTAEFVLLRLGCPSIRERAELDETAFPDANCVACYSLGRARRKEMMRGCTRCGMWLDEPQGGYCIYCRRKVREAQAELGEWVEGREGNG